VNTTAKEIYLKFVLLSYGNTKFKHIIKVISWIDSISAKKQGVVQNVGVD
jgi:hypothetical protein